MLPICRSTAECPDCGAGRLRAIVCGTDEVIAANPLRQMQRALPMLKRLPIRLVAALVLASPAQAEMLISAQEARLPESPFNERSAFPGPKVLLVSPDSKATAVKSPFRLRVRFEPRGAKIDLDSLQVTFVNSHRLI